MPKGLVFLLKLFCIVVISGLVFYVAEILLWVFFPSNVNGLIAFILAVCVGMMGLVFVLDINGPEVKKQRPDLLQTEETLAAASALQTERTAPERVWAGDSAHSAFFVGVEDRACVIGPPGTGKTVFLVSQLYHWCQTGQPFVVLDVKPEIHGLVKDQLERWGYDLKVLNPTSGQGQQYNLLDDLTGLESIGELAAALIPANEQSPVFGEIARDLLDAIIHELRAEGGANLPQVRAFLSRFENHQALIKALTESKQAAVKNAANSLRLIAGSDRLLGSIFAAFQSNLRFLNYVGDRLDRSDFSLHECCGDKPVGLFVQVEEKHQESIAQFTTAFIGHLLRFFIEHTQRPPVLLLLDEIGNVPPINGLAQKLNTIRSRRLPTWMYWQSLAQMQPYGGMVGQGQSLILGACDVQIFFRLNDNDTANYVSDKIGRTDRVVDSLGVSMAHSSPPTLTANKSLVENPMIFPHELQQLSPHEIVICYRGLSFKAQATPYFQQSWPVYAPKRSTPAFASSYMIEHANSD